MYVVTIKSKINPNFISLLTLDSGEKMTDDLNLAVNEAKEMNEVSDVTGSLYTYHVAKLEHI